jgi:predicted dehydrogenase
VFCSRAYVVTLDRLLIVGLGSIGKRHARLARALLPDTEITVLRHQVCDDLWGTGIDYCVTSIDAALAREPQAAVIASPASRHLASALPLARMGTHILLEKPIASDSVGVNELIEVAHSRRIILMTAYNLRFLPSLQRFREIVRERRVGRVLSVRAEIGQYLPSWRPLTDYRESVSARAEHGGGVMLELSHEIDYLRWIFGDVDWLTATVRRQSDLEINVADTAMLTLVFHSQQKEPPVLASLNMDFVRHDMTRRCTVIGESGTIRWDALAGSVEIFAAGAAKWNTVMSQPPEPDESYLAEWRHFLKCIESGDPPIVSGEDGLAVLRVVEAAHASSATGNAVSLGVMPTNPITTINRL